jgi:hypothetical protein
MSKKALQRILCTLGFSLYLWICGLLVSSVSSTKSPKQKGMEEGKHESYHATTRIANPSRHRALSCTFSSKISIHEVSNTVLPIQISMHALLAFNKASCSLTCMRPLWWEVSSSRHHNKTKQCHIPWTLPWTLNAIYMFKWLLRLASGIPNSRAAKEKKHAVSRLDTYPLDHCVITCSKFPQIPVSFWNNGFWGLDRVTW